ncbi:MAG: alpha/beta hydrolase [Desulfobacterales bacterium]|jgi:proline iminopeptidase
MRNQNTFICCLLLILLFSGCEAKAQQSEKNVVTVNGVKLHYTIEGSGITTMVIGSAIQQPRMFSQELRKQFKFIFMDTRLFIPASIEKFTLDDAVEDIEGFRKYLDIDKMVVMGNSMLAIIALEYAKKYPQRVSHLVMIGISPIFDDSYYKERNKYWESQATEERKQIWKENKKKLTEELRKNVSPEKARVLQYVSNGPKRCYDAKYDASWLFEGATVNTSKGVNNFIKSFYTYDMKNNIQKVSIPVLLVVGRYDFNNPYYLWNDFKSKFYNLEYHLFEKSGHYPMLEEPKLFNQTLTKFICQYNKKNS